MRVIVRECILAGAKCYVTTVITETFLPYAAALRESRHRTECPPAFLEFVVERTDNTALPDSALPLQALESTLPRVQQMCVRFQGESDANSLRWSLKSQAMKYCINQGAERVLWCDPDLYFFEDPAILFKMIEPGTVLLTPHCRAFRPSTCHINFSKNYTEGVFIHFTDWTIEQILMEVDPLLAPHVEEYLRVLREFDTDISLRHPVAASVPVIETKTRPATQSPGRRLLRRVRGIFPTGLSATKLAV